MKAFLVARSASGSQTRVQVCELNLRSICKLADKAVVVFRKGLAQDPVVFVPPNPTEENTAQPMYLELDEENVGAEHYNPLVPIKKKKNNKRKRNASNARKRTATSRAITKNVTRKKKHILGLGKDAKAKKSLSKERMRKNTRAKLPPTSPTSSLSTREPELEQQLDAPSPILLPLAKKLKATERGRVQKRQHHQSAGCRFCYPTLRGYAYETEPPIPAPNT
jgi:hypothetical protein